MKTYKITTIVNGRAVTRAYRLRPKRLVKKANRCFYCHNETDSEILGMFDERVCTFCATGPRTSLNDDNSD